MIGRLGTRLRTLTERRVFRQAAGYGIATGTGALLAALAQVVITRSVPVTEFGEYGFSVSFLQLTAILFEFGLFVPAARLAAREADSQQHLIGAAMLLYLPVGGAFCLLTLAMSFTVDNWASVDAGHLLLLASPLAFVVPFALVSQLLAQGVGRLHLYSVALVLSQVLFLGSVCALELVGGLSVEWVVILRLVTLGIGGLAVVLQLRPIFGQATGSARRLIQEAKRYGFGVYVGRVFSTGTYNLDVVMIAIYADATAVALYTVARSVAMVASMPVLGFASALFPRMAVQRGLRAEWLRTGWGVGGGIAGLLILVSPFVIPAVYGEPFRDAATYVVPLGLAEAVRGVTGIYNSYLAAQGQGRALRNAGIVLTLTNLAANFILIPPYGATGAAWASLIALVINLGAHVVGYRRAQRAGGDQAGSDLSASGN